MKKEANTLRDGAAIAAVLLLSLGIFVYSGDIAHALGRYSYAGLFFVSFIASASVFFPTAPLNFAILGIGAQLDPLLVGLVAGIGSGLGEWSGYMVGSGSKDILEGKNGYSRWFLKLQKSLFGRHATATVFLFAFLPNPLFDFAGLFAGAIKMPAWKFLLATILGRILRYFLLAAIGVAALHSFA